MNMSTNTDITNVEISTVASAPSIYNNDALLQEFINEVMEYSTRSSAARVAVRDDNLDAIELAVPLAEAAEAPPPITVTLSYGAEQRIVALDLSTTCVFGSDNANSVPNYLLLPPPYEHVSENHAELKYKGGVFEFTDISKIENATFALRSGTYIKKCTLSSGDKFCIGETILTIQF
jgi:hypothetical protein